MVEVVCRRAVPGASCKRRDGIVWFGATPAAEQTEGDGGGRLLCARRPSSAGMDGQASKIDFSASRLGRLTRMIWSQWNSLWTSG